MTTGVRAAKISFLLLLFLSIAAISVAAFEGEEDAPAYTVLEKAYWWAQGLMNSEEAAGQEAIWVRPGLNLKITDASIPADRKPVVTFTITDNGGQGLDRLGVQTPTTVSIRFILAYIPKGATQYVDYTTRTVNDPNGKPVIQATTDSTGTWTSLGNGSYTYKFNTTLPTDYDTTATHTLGIQASRNMSEFGLSLYVANELKSWIPATGAAPTVIRDIVPTAACNQCHDPIAAHGSGRRKVEYCILCHTPQTLDAGSGNTADMKVMVHKIHYGPNLPSVKAGKPYYFGTNPAGSANFSYTTYPQDIKNCQTCHKDTQQVNNWLLNPTRDTCGSCHDDLNWLTGANHKGGAQADDKSCAICHQPESGTEFDASVKGAHTVLYKSKNLLYPKVEILSVTNTTPGSKPTVTFKITDGKGNVIDHTKLSGTVGRIAITIAGPTTDYRWYLQEVAQTAPIVNGNPAYTFTGVIPADAKGTYAAEVEGRIVTKILPGPLGSTTTTYQESWPTAVKYFAVTDKTAVARRTVVDLAKCNKCHEKLQLHGSNRNTIEACVICHNPATTDIAQRTAGTNTPSESIDMKLMIHKIHTGEELAYDYTVYGYGKNPYTFNEVLYPGDRRNCQACHTSANYTVPLPSVVTPTTTPRGFWNPTLPTAAACLGCHDSLEAAAHAYVNTTSVGEACSVCHKETADAGVSKAHAR